MIFGLEGALCLAIILGLIELELGENRVGLLFQNVLLSGKTRLVG
jgi:hypothetical protein